jgi:hypothetical protein
MITITFIFIAAAVGYFYITSVNSGSNREFDNAKSHLSEILDRLFVAAPFQNIMGDEKECQLSVRFTVNEYYELTNLKISGENEELVKFAHMKLPGEISKYVDDIVPSKYNVKLRFVLK